MGRGRGGPLSSKLYLVHGADPVSWARRWGLEPVSVPCTTCGADRNTTVPFAQGQLRGLAAPPCVCGNRSRAWCVVRDPKYGDLFDGPLM